MLLSASSVSYTVLRQAANVGLYDTPSPYSVASPADSDVASSFGGSRHPIVLSVNLTEELLERIEALSLSGKKCDISIEFGATESAAENQFCVGDMSFGFRQTGIGENVIECVRASSEAHTLTLCGRVRSKISMHRVLDDKQRAEIRARTNEADEDRRSRKAVLMSKDEVETRGLSNRGRIMQNGNSLRQTMASPSLRSATQRSHLTLSPHLKSVDAAMNEPESDSQKLEMRLLHLLALQPQRLDVLAAKTQTTKSVVEAALRNLTRVDMDGISSLTDKAYLRLQVGTWPRYSASERDRVRVSASAALDRLGYSRDAPERKMLLSPPVSTVQETISDMDVPPAESTPSRPVVKKQQERIIQKLTSSKIKRIVPPTVVNDPTAKRRRSDASLLPAAAMAAATANAAASLSTVVTSTVSKSPELVVSEQKESKQSNAELITNKTIDTRRVTSPSNPLTVPADPNDIDTNLSESSNALLNEVQTIFEGNSLIEPRALYRRLRGQLRVLDSRLEELESHSAAVLARAAVLANDSNAKNQPSEEDLEKEARDALERAAPQGEKRYRMLYRDWTRLQKAMNRLATQIKKL